MNHKRLFLGLLLLLAAGVVRADVAEDRNKTEDSLGEIMTEAQAMKTVAKLGGMVGWHEGAPGKPVVQVYLISTTVTERDLRDLAGFPHLKLLKLNGTPLTDTDLEALARLKQLRGLCLTSTNASEAGREKLQRALPGCHILYH